MKTNGHGCLKHAFMFVWQTMIYVELQTCYRFNKHRSEAIYKISWKSNQNVARTNYFKLDFSMECVPPVL